MKYQTHNIMLIGKQHTSYQDHTHKQFKETLKE